jgi:hypothetical protein
VLQVPSNECVYSSCTSKSSHSRKKKEMEEEEEGFMERQWDSWTMCNVSLCFSVTIVSLRLECKEGASVLNKEPCKFLLSTCDHSFP